MAKVFPSGSNTYVLDHESSGRLTVDYSRNPDKFIVNKYAQIIPVTKDRGYYLAFTNEEAGRIPNVNLSDFFWEDGADAPDHTWGTESHDWTAYECVRKSYGWRLGDKALAQASWNLESQNQGRKAQQAMTARTVRAHNLLSTAGNWPTNHSSNVTAIGGVTGQWDASTVARQDVKRSLQFAQEQIDLSTLAAVDPGTEALVIGPDVAQGLAITQEFVNHVNQSPQAYGQWKGDLPGLPNNQKYGMTDRLYSVDVFVDTTAKVTSAKSATRSAAFVWTSSEAVLVARPGTLVATEAGGPAYSTLAFLVYEEMTSEILRDENNRVVKGRIVEDFDTILLAGESGFRFGSPVA